MHLIKILLTKAFKIKFIILTFWLFMQIPGSHFASELYFMANQGVEHYD